MQFRDLKKQYCALKKEIDEAIFSVTNECNFINGHQVVKLEEELADYVGVKHCITCGNGTDALTMAMMAWGIKEGDAVFVPDFTFFSSGEIVAYTGATPIFIDVEKDTYNIDVDSLEKAIDIIKKEGKLIPKAVVAVDLFGLPANFGRLKSVASRNNLLILEDGAQGFGGMIGNKKACSFGDISTTSFFPAKPLGCYGDGGAIFTNSDSIAELLKSIRVHGKGNTKYDNIRIGLNSRLDTMQAAILSVKLKAFENELDSVNDVAKKYTEKLSGIVRTPVVPNNYYSSWAQYTIQLDSRETRDALQEELKNNGIPSMVYYMKPMHCQKAFDNIKVAVTTNKNTIELCDTVLSLPMHPYITDEEINTVISKITSFVKGF